MIVFDRLKNDLNNSIYVQTKENKYYILYFIIRVRLLFENHSNKKTVHFKLHVRNALSKRQR